MVEDTGTAPRAVSVKRVNEPEPLAVEETAGGQPAALRFKARQQVAAIEDTWRIDDEWWRPRPVTRVYYAVILENGRKLVIYRDLAAARWYRQPY